MSIRYFTYERIFYQGDSGLVRRAEKQVKSALKNLFCLSLLASLKDFSRQAQVFRAKRTQP